MHRINLKIISFLLVIFGFMMFFQTRSDQKVVAIAQIIEHPSLDAERVAMTEVFEKNGLKVVCYNANGVMSTATQIAQQIVASKPAAVVAISTPSAQSLIGLCEKSDIPFVYTAVTDPKASRLDNAIGVSDVIPPESPWQMIRHIQPRAKKIGVIYNPGESNSVSMVEAIELKAKDFNFEILLVPIHKVSDVAQAVHSLLGQKIDAIYVPNDNMAVAAMPTIVQISHSQNIPVYASDEGSVQNGAVAMCGWDRRTLGLQAAREVLDLLKINQIFQTQKAELKWVINPQASKLFPNLNWSKS